MDDVLKLVVIGLGVFVLVKVTETPTYAAPYYIPYFFPWISNRFVAFPGGGGWPPLRPWPRPPLGDGEGVEMGGSGHGGGHER